MKNGTCVTLITRTRAGRSGSLVFQAARDVGDRKARLDFGRGGSLAADDKEDIG
jgi:hypothetical protein